MSQLDVCKENRRYLAGEFKKYQKVFEALGDEVRQTIIITLLENEAVGMRVPQITERTHLSRPAVSHHLQILKDAGLINMYRIGTKNFYYIDANAGCWDGLRALVNQAADIVEKAKATGYPVLSEEN